MQNKTAKKPQDFMKKDELHFLLAKIKHLHLLNEHVQIILDPSIRDCCQVANMVQKQLVLLVANASIATTIRFSKDLLLSKFKRDRYLKEVSDIHCIVRMNVNMHIHHQRLQRPTQNLNQENQMPQLSNATAKMIQDIAQTIQDERLKEVMQKIAEHTA